MKPDPSTLTDEGLRDLCCQALVNQPTDAQMAIHACRVAIRNRCFAILERWAKKRSEPADAKTRAAGMDN